MAENKPTNRERLREITDGIEQGIKELFESEKYMRYLSVMSRFHRYSVNNTMLIYMQKPDATLVAGYNKWKDQFERHVKKGEHGITIIAPTPVSYTHLPAQQADLIRDYCREFFVSKGMIADFAIHDKADGNPHAHILLTMRAMDETGKWLPKSRKVYDLDENGERIRLPSGSWKSHKEDTVDSVSYTHLDVYKRQVEYAAIEEGFL